MNKCQYEEFGFIRLGRGIIGEPLFSNSVRLIFKSLNFNEDKIIEAVDHVF